MGYVLAERGKNKDKKSPPFSADNKFQWLGYLDSNQGITVSETVVLPLDYIPRALNSLEILFLFVNSFFKKQSKGPLFIVAFSRIDFPGPVNLL